MSRSLSLSVVAALMLAGTISHVSVRAQQSSGPQLESGANAAYDDGAVPPPFLIEYGLQAVEYGSVDLGDYDGDGDEDLLLTGHQIQNLYAVVYCRSEQVYSWSVGEAVFFDTTSIFLTTPAVLNNVWQSSAKWGDYDSDGDLDVVVTGITLTRPEVGTTIREPVAHLYENRNGIFNEDRRFELPPVYGGEASWGDYDGDGDLDLVLTGATRIQRPYDPIAVILRNDGSGFARIEAGLPGLAFGGADWGDYDGDGDLDLALSGERGDARFLTAVFRNEGGGVFSQTDVDLPPLAFGSVRWGDMEADGDLDLLVSGGTPDPRTLRGVTKVFRNEGGSFVDHEAGLPGVLTGDAIWTDFDVDGLLDVVLTGTRDPFASPEAWIYLQRSGTFERFYKLGDLTFSDIAAGDYNADGDPDVVMIGRGSDGAARVLFFQNAVIRDWNPFDEEGAMPVGDLEGGKPGCIQG